VNKAHAKSGGKVETKRSSIMSSANRSSSVGKNVRNNIMVEKRRAQREEMIMKRRGLNFVTEHHEELVA